jgi:hypothetical protein
MPSPFAENDVEVLHRYLPDALHAALQRARAELKRTSVEGMLSPSDFTELKVPLTGGRREQQRLALAINDARERVLRVCQRASLGLVAPAPTDRPPAVAILDNAIDGVLQHDLANAIAQLSALDGTAPPLTGIALDRATIRTAMEGDPRPYFTTRATKVVNGKAIFVVEPRTLPGFGPAAMLSAARVDELFLLLSFLTASAERTFRIRIARAEAHVAIGQFAEALEQYQSIPPTPGPDGMPSPRDKFVALKSGLAELANGDALFRRAGIADAATSAAIAAAYERAVAHAQSRAIAAENPVRRQIEQVAAIQRAKLDAGLNVLGYRDSYVPVQRPAALLALAERRIEAASEAAQRYELFKSKAEAIQDQLRQLDFEQDIKAKELAVANLQLAKAEEQVTIVDTQIDKISVQLDNLKTVSVAEIGGALLSGLAQRSAAGGGQAAAGQAAAGVLTTAANYRARADDLRFEQAIAESQLAIARRDVTIAQLGRQVAETTIDFLAERVQRIQNRELNADLYFAAGEVFRTLAVRHLDEAIVWSFLFERAVAFLRLEPELRAIRLDYLDGPGGLLTAPDRLRLDLDAVVDRNLPITKFQFLTESFSLRTLFPIEFNRFLQTGRMDFTLSLYELNKRRPGVFRQRIKRVQVELQFPPPTGFTGRIRHRGSFLLRDRDSTPDASTGRFVPTPDALASAFAALGAGATQGLSIGGVMPFLLDVDTLELSLDQPPPDLTDPAPEALMPIEGYGLTGDWTLEVENVDLRFITDAILRVTSVIPESDDPLSQRVKGLIAAYERELVADDTLDAIASFALRQRFPDTLTKMAAGEGRLTLARGDFPAGVANLRVKTLIVQLLDANRKGVEGVRLEISRPGTALRLERTTAADGFSEDLTHEIPVQPPADRVDVEGVYHLRVVDPPGFAAVKDAIVFVLYAFTEAVA